MKQVQIEGYKTEKITLRVNEADLIDKVIQLLLVENDLAYGRFLSECKTKIMIDNDHYHGSASYSVVRLATINDLEVFAMVDRLEALKQRKS